MLDFFVIWLDFCVFSLGYCEFVVSTSAINCLERLVSKMTYHMSVGTLNLVHSVTVMSSLVNW